MKKISTSLALKLRQDSIVERDYIIFSGEETKHYIWFNLYDDCYNNGNFIGTFVMKRLELTYNDSDLEFKQKEFNAYKEYKLDDGTWESIDYGTFIVQAVEESDTKEEIKVTAYDYTLKFANTYVSDLDYQSGEITLLQVLQECCDKCGIELATTEFANSSFKVDSNQFDGLSMYGNVIGAVAGISCNFAKIKADNKLYLEFKTETGIIIEASDYEEFEDKRDTLEYNAVSLGMANVEGENVTMVAKGVDPEKAKFLTINDNQFAYTIEKRNELITAIFNKINGFSYSSIVLKNCMFPQLECGDLIQIKNKDGQLVNSIVLRPTYEETQIKLEAPSTISSTVSYLNPPEAYDIAKLTQIEIDKAIGQIQSLTIRTEQIVDNINNNYYTVKQTNELIQTAESGITNTFSESGGNNILRNTGLWFKNDGEDSKKDKTIIGSNIKLFDALDETVNNVRINGYTRQITTTGDNFYNKDFSNISSLIKEEDNDWFSYSYDHSAGTATTYSNFFTYASDLLKTSTKYYCVVELKDVEIAGNVSMTVTDGYYSNEQFQTGFKIEKDDLQSKAIVIKALTTRDNFDGRTLLLRSFFTLRAGSKISLKFRISLRGKAQTEDNFVYEPYTGGKPSPNPDYPQEVEVAKGKNILPYPFVDTTKTINGITFTDNEDGTITVNGTSTNNANFVLFGKSTNQKEILGNYLFGGSSKVWNRIVHYEDSNYIVLTTSKANESISIDKTQYNTGYIELVVPKGYTVENEVITPLMSIDKVDEYEPYDSIVAKSTGKNLFKPILANKDGMTPTISKDGTITINGTTTKTYADITSKYNKVLATGKYTFSIDRVVDVIVVLKFAFSDGTTYDIRITPGNLSKTYTFTKEPQSMYMFIQGLQVGQKITNLSFKTQLEEGNIATECKPYQESKLTYSLNDNFIAEQDYIQDNKLYKNVARLILNGSEDYFKSRNSSVDAFTFSGDSKPYQDYFKINVVSNRFIYQKKVGVATGDENKMIYSSSANQVYFVFKKGTMDSVDNLKQWLSEHPVEVYYQLETPTTVDLEPSGELKTYKDYTSISNNVNTEMEINYNAIYSIYEFWTGNVKKETNSNSSSYNSLLLQRGSLKQEQDVPNGNYSISFTYKKLIELANATVKINENEYNLDSLEYKQFYTGQQDESGNYITSPIEVSSGHISIEFITDANNSVEVYDIMCNKGNVKLAWSQNENEVTTDTVNISKGITITSSYMETIFKANANGIKILTLQGETIAYFTEKGLTTKEAIIEEKAEICGTLITDVGDQTWFTRM